MKISPEFQFLPLVVGPNRLRDEMPDNLAGCEFADDWTLLDGLDIEIQENGKIIDRGRVEVATKDGAILWLVPNGLSSRRLIEKMPGRFVRILPAQG